MPSSASWLFPHLVWKQNTALSAGEWSGADLRQVYPWLRNTEQTCQSGRKSGAGKLTRAATTSTTQRHVPTMAMSSSRGQQTPHRQENKSFLSVWGHKHPSIRFLTLFLLAVAGTLRNYHCYHSATMLLLHFSQLSSPLPRRRCGFVISTLLLQRFRRIIANL